MRTFCSLSVLWALAIGIWLSSSTPRANADGISGSRDIEATSTTLDLGQDSTSAPDTVPASFVMKYKLSQSDDPHLPEFVRAMFACGTITGTYKICVHKNGEISHIEPVVTIPGSDFEIMTELTRWRFSALPQPACFLQRFTFRLKIEERDCPFSDPPLVPRDWVDGAKLSIKDEPQLPVGHSPPSVCDPLIGVYKLCIEPTGSVRVSVVRSIEGLDRHILNTLGKWRYRRMGVPACIWQHIQFPSTGSDQCPGERLEPEATHLEVGQVISARSIRTLKISGDDPHLSSIGRSLGRLRGQMLKGTYKICISNNGMVAAIDPERSLLREDESVMQTLLTWRYKPLFVPKCFMQHLQYVFE